MRRAKGQEDVARWRGRRTMAIIVTLVLAAALIMLAAGCGSEGGEGATASPSAGGVTAGGVLQVGGYAAQAQFDPALSLGNSSDQILMRQVCDKLVRLTTDFTVAPCLATEWDSPDGKVWTFTLRDGVTFSNGESFTSEDVVYTINRLRDKELGSVMAETYSIITDVTADDPTHVTFTLNSANAEFPALLADYHSVMLCKSVADPMKELIGTGAFVLESFKAEDRAVLKKNPNYWGTDEEGNKLPYLDEIDFIYSPELAGLVQGLQGDTLQFVGGLTAELRQSIEGNPSIKTITTIANSCYSLQFRCDRGLGKDVKFRQALLAGTDREAIVQLVASGLADPGNGTLVGPAYKDVYLPDPGTYDPEKAKQLLSETAYKGEAIELLTMTGNVFPQLAEAWQAQMKEIGVKVEINMVPPDVFYGPASTEEADFATVDWGTRATPSQYFDVAFVTDGPWNFERWSNAEFDAIVDQIALELDAVKRAELYKQAQQILIDEVPFMNYMVMQSCIGASAKIDGVAIEPDWQQTGFERTYFTE